MRFRYPFLLVLAALLLAPAASAQSVVINEVDADQTGTDAAEFVELFNPGTAPADLSGHVLVFFNGSDDASYEPAFDLDGVTIAAGGYYVICGDAANVANCDREVGTGTTNLIQNGADAVALLMGNATDYPEDTAPPTSGIVDAIVYDTDDSDDEALLAALGQSFQYDEDAGGAKDTESLQRSPDGDGTVITATPTPGAANAILTEPEVFTALLRGENEVPAFETDAKGGTTVTLDGATVTVTGSFAGLTGDYQASHIHGGAAGENGGVVQGLMPTLNTDNRGGTFEAAMNTFTVRPTFADSLRAGLAYVNIHSAASPSGEIRGQINRDSQTLPFALSGDNEVPAVSTPATGSGTVTLDGAMVTVTGSFSGLTGDYRASHIHGGAADENGPVVQGLMPTVDADMRGGTFAADMNMYTVRTTFADSIRAGLAYVNVHSAAFPSGEIRGQIGTEAPLMAITIAEARAQGSGATILVEGTVTRAQGDFAYFQDDTAGLALRQTSGAFFDAIAAGDIAPGTQIRVEGTLSEFNGLLQVNEADLADYSVTGSGDVPAAQVVTLEDLATNGEDYEAELVTIGGVTFTDTGDFAAGTNYSVSDGTAAGDVILRVPNADDSTVDGTSIPTQANVTGIVGQFDRDDPRDAGYQLLLISAGDIENTVANETDEAAANSLAVANPIRGTTTVRFSLGAPGQATVALYDALGRQVAVLAQGTFDTSVQTVSLNASTLATGVYVLRMQGETDAVTRTVTVVR